MMPKIARMALAASALALVAGCTVQPLHGSVTGTTVEIGEAGDRVTQQVRNQLLYRLGPSAVSNGAQRALKLTVDASVDGVLTVGTDGDSNTSVRRLKLTGTAEITDPLTGAVVSKDTRMVTASFDATGQEFANDRARIDAENRAGRELAEQLFAIIRIRLNAS